MSSPAVPYSKALRLFPELRQSLLASFDQCGLSTKFDIQHRHGWSHPYQARGEMFHRFAARALATMAKQREETIPVDAALEILHEVLRQEDVDKACPRCGSARIRKGVTRRGMRYCLSCRRQFETDFIRVPTDMIEELYWVVKKWAHDNAFDILNLLDVEKKLVAEISYPNTVATGNVWRTLTGTLDALFIEGENDDHAIVLDWKDMWKLPAQTEIGHGGYFQQRKYGYLIFACYPTVEQVTLREFYVRYSKPREATLIRSRDFDQIREELSAIVLNFDRAVEENLWVPTPGAQCGWCPMPQRCPIHPEARGEGRITSHEEARTVAAQFLVAEALVKQYRGQLTPWTNMHGPIPVRDAKGRRVVGFRPTTKTYKPTIEQIEEAEQAKGGPLTAAEIQSLERVKHGTELTTFVPDPAEVAKDDAELIEALQQSVADAEQAA